MSNGVKAWSYSAYQTYMQCPAKYKYQKIDKLPEEKSPAMLRGIKIHAELENYLKKPSVTEVPKEAGEFSNMLRDLKELNPFVEQKWGFTEDWKVTTFYNKKVWLRSILDAGTIYPDNTATIVDFKTGKLYDTNEDQIQLFSLTVMTKYPEVKSVDTRLWYVDTGDEVVRTYNRDDKKKLQGEWSEKVKPMFNDETFAPRPNKFCNWCSFSKKNGGPCKF